MPRITPAAQAAPAEINYVTNDTLALKYRPHRFEDVAGQQGTVRDMRGILKTQRIPNAIMYIGKSGVGKTTLSRMLSQYLNCRTSDACGTCAVCVKCDAGGMPPDYMEINAATDGGIDAVKLLIDQARMNPSHRIRIIYIDEAHRLTLAASNALLKTLEEPPARTLWILATNEPDKIPNSTAIRGRCAIMQLYAVTKEDVARRITAIAAAEGYSWMDNDIALAIGEAGGGAVRDSVQILDSVQRQVAGMDSVPRPRRLVRQIRQMIGQAESTSIDRAAQTTLVGVYRGDAAAVVQGILDAEDYIPLITKMLNINFYLVGELSGHGKHQKIWSNTLNVGTLKSLRANGGKPRLGDAIAIHRELTDIRSKTQTFAVDAQHLLISGLCDLAVDLAG